MNNQKIRKALKEAKMKYWELSELLEISPETLSRRLRHELPEDDQKRIAELISKHQRMEVKNG